MYTTCALEIQVLHNGCVYDHIAHMCSYLYFYIFLFAFCEKGLTGGHWLGPCIAATGTSLCNWGAVKEKSEN